MAAPTIYRWDDPSAPVFNRGEFTTNDGSESLENVFRKCLVDGYGAKASAGWTVSFNDTTKFILKQGGSRTVKAEVKFHGFTSGSNYWYSNIEATQSYSDIDTPVNKFSASSQYVDFGYSNFTNYKIPWVIFANDRSFYAVFGYNSGEDATTVPTQFSPGSTSRWSAFFFGDYKCYEPSYDYNQLIVSGGTNSSRSSYQGYSLGGYTITSSTTTQHSKFAPADIAGSPASTDVRYLTMRANNSTGSGYNAALGAYTFLTEPDQFSSNHILDKVRLVYDGTLVGEMPGMAYSLQGISFARSNDVITFTGVGDFAGDTMHVIQERHSQPIISDGDWETGT